jgi:isopenicillin N synthase-like dioxygenase
MAEGGSLESLPIVNIADLDLPDRRKDVLQQLRQTMHDHGFLYLEGHGIAQALIDDVLAASRQFFDLDIDQKRSIEMVKSPHFRGYTLAGAEHTRGLPDWREQLDIGTELPAQQLTPTSPAWARLQGPNQWPAVLPTLKPLLLDYLDQVTRLGISLTGALAESIGQSPEIFKPIYTPLPNQLLKIIRYPGQDAITGDQGVGAHKDSGFVTILLQGQRDGLEIEKPQGWIAAPPRRGSFIINIGELLEIATNGYFRAAVHRVVSPPAGTDRLSVAFFFGARLDSTVPQLTLPPDLAVQSQGLTQDSLNPLFREVGKNFLKSRLRSHPDVARRHHADLLDPATLQNPAGPGSAY